MLLPTVGGKGRCPHHLVNGVEILRVFLVLLCFLIACLALVLSVLLGERVTPMARYAHEVIGSTLPNVLT